jgi:hypothetical protein
VVVSEGRILVTRIGDGVIESRAEGFMSRRVVAAHLGELDEILRHEHGVLRHLSDALAVEGMEPGIPILAAQWAARHAHRRARTAIVARLPTLVAVMRAMRYILPTIQYGVFTTREEASLFLSEPLAAKRSPGSRRRSQRPSISRP